MAISSRAESGRAAVFTFDYRVRRRGGWRASRRRFGAASARRFRVREPVLRVDEPPSPALAHRGRRRTKILELRLAHRLLSHERFRGRVTTVSRHCMYQPWLTTTLWPVSASIVAHRRCSERIARAIHAGRTIHPGSQGRQPRDVPPSGSGRGYTMARRAVVGNGVEDALKAAVAERVGPSRFDVWFGEGVKLGVDGDALVVGVPNGFFRDRIRGLTHVQGKDRVNLEAVGDADVIALHQAAGQTCVQVFFFRGGRNNGNRPYFLSKGDQGPEEVIGAFLGQLYDDLPPPPLVLLSHEPAERTLIAEALCAGNARPFAADAKGPVGAAVFLIGHDTNLAAVAGLLGLDWHDPARPDDYPPGGALVFDLVAGAAGPEVRLSVAMPMLSALRRGGLDGAGDMVVETVAFPLCGAGPCTPSRFAELARQAIDLKAVVASEPARSFTP